MTSDNRKDLGEILKQQRITMRLSVRTLATASGVSVAHLYRIERGERFPSARVLDMLAKPLGFVEIELLTQAGYLPSQPSTGETQQSLMRLLPCVAIFLSKEPVEIQRTVIGILAILLKSLARVGDPAEWPEFREYMRRKYPNLEEDAITLIEDLIERSLYGGASRYS